MTKWSEVEHDPNAIKCLDHGFVVLQDYMGDDKAIADAARTSYAKGTKTVNEDRGLIRYLVRHHHSSPLEQGEVKFLIKLPIFVMRQLDRHRTSNQNQQSYRYSLADEDYYIPALDVIQPQSKDNKQGRYGDIDLKSKEGVQWLIKTSTEHSYDIYNILLGEGKDNDNLLYDPYGEEDALLDPEFPGIARELARTVLPVNGYTQVIWKQDIRNLMHLIGLRSDPHAQYEVRVFSDAMYKLVKPLFPHTCEAYEDYVFKATNLSRMDKNLMATLLKSSKSAQEKLMDLLEDHRSVKNLAEHYEMSVRELRDFANNFNLTLD